MKEQDASAQTTVRHTAPEELAQTQLEAGQEARVKPTPLLLVLGVVALLAGLMVGLLMSQATFLR